MRRALAGFTLIELIITLVLISIVSVVVFSRFQDPSSFDAVGLRGQIHSAIRQMQLRAMQDTRPGYCHRYNIDTTAPAAGPPTNDYRPGPAQQAASCATTVGTSVPSNLVLTSSRLNQSNATLSATDGNQTINGLDFDSLGRPLTAISNCVNECRITVSTGVSASVCINQEGYIRECDS